MEISENFLAELCFKISDATRIDYGIDFITTNLGFKTEGYMIKLRNNSTVIKKEYVEYTKLLSTEPPKKELREKFVTELMLHGILKVNEMNEISLKTPPPIPPPLGTIPIDLTKQPATVINNYYYCCDKCSNKQ